MSQVNFQQLTDYANDAIARLKLQKLENNLNEEIPIRDKMAMGDDEFCDPEEYAANFQKRFELTCDKFMLAILAQGGKYTKIAISAGYDMMHQSTYILFQAYCPLIGTVRIL